MKKVLFAIAAGLLLLASCQKAPQLTITSPASIDLNVDGSSGTITFTANRDWTVSASDSWVTVSPSSGAASDAPVTVTVRCNANTTYDDRTATVTIRMEDQVQTVTIRQPANIGVVLPKQVFELQSDAKSIDVEVQANVEYTVSASVDWIKQTGTKGLTSKTLTFSIEENATYDSREGKITIKPQDGSVQEQVISVKQAQMDALNVEKTTYDMPYGGGEIEIKVEANVSFDVTPNADWIHYVQTKALSNSTVVLKIDENATYSAREGKVEIKQQNGSLKHTITVNQAGRIAVTSVKLDKTSLSIKPGDTATLVATVKPDNATDKTVTWTSSDSAIATVDETGKVTAVKIGSATITAKAGEQSATCSVKVPKAAVPEAIPLGLSVKWASFNIGASKPEEYGDYYAWGETETKSEYSWSTYKWANGQEDKLTKYCDSYKYWDGAGNPDGKTVLDPEDDVAHVKLGGKWRMPTDAEWTELRNNCTWTWTTQHEVYGILVTSKKYGTSIFLPAAGNWQGTKLVSTGSYGYYWSSSLTTGYPNYAWLVYFSSGDVYRYFGGRNRGLSVRAVSE